MKTSTSTYSKIASAGFMLLFPIMSGCSVFSGNDLSDSPAVAAQQQRIEALKADVKEAERYTEEAEQREKAAKSRLKAAEHELKAAEAQAKRRGY
ncbi:hypothetical protein I2I11_10325 [Pontibacter sp. 172403-2]|uniref:hypothetical protein n=1 Tax=Pontibacter rufus TaxID=2791028 RepID=UPI0018AFB392|nr:hypothetical protein [Pontibacter sp. 172403-2]MBF9253688.1 hypothetical protein [Pontibacter sp. 172403-2]